MLTRSISQTIRRYSSSPAVLRPAPVLLEKDIKEKHLADLATSGWKPVEGRDAIQKVYMFEDFAHAFGFMAKCAIRADKCDHHPEWFNVYNKVDVTLSTHDCGGLSQLDIDMAKTMDRFATY